MVQCCLRPCSNCSRAKQGVDLGQREWRAPCGQGCNQGRSARVSESHQHLPRPLASFHLSNIVYIILSHASWIQWVTRSLPSKSLLSLLKSGFHIAVTDLLLSHALKGLRKRLLAELVYDVSEKCLIRNPPYLRSLRLSLPECLSLLSLVYNWALTSRGLLKTDTVLHFL